MIDDDAPLRPRANVLLTEMRDGTGVLLDLDSKFYFNLNATGLHVWKALEGQGGASLSTLATLLHEAYDVERAQALQDVRALCVELHAEGLLEVAAQAGRAP